MEKLLIVDDDKILTRLVSETLAKATGAITETARSFKEARDLIENRENTFFLAILDYSLPDAPDGQIIDYVISRGIPTLVLTAMYDTAIRDEMLQKTIVDYIVKRSAKDLEYLVSVVGRIMKNRQTKALVVDDSSTIRQSMGNLLKNQLLNVYTAEDGLKAKAIIKENPDIKIVITDYLMPNMDGLELLTQIRKDFPKDRMSVIIASGIGGSNVVPHFLKAGANDYLLKPFNPEEFICRVNMNLDYLNMIEIMRDLINKDTLTGLHNRRFLFEAGTTLHAAAIRYALNMAVFVIDIDGFKAINDTYGHNVGDMVIRLYSEALLTYFKRKTDVVTRIGGDEFCVVTSYDSAENLTNFAEHLRNFMEAQTISFKGTSISCSASIGVCGKLFDTLEEMIRHADNMMYKAKQDGKNRVCIY